MKKELLFFETFIPTPDKDAGSYRCFSLLKILNKKYNVSLISIHPGKDKYISLLRSSKIGYFCLNKLSDQAIEKFIKKSNTIIISRPSTYIIISTLLNEYNYKGHVIYDSVDLHHLRFKTHIDNLKTFNIDTLNKHNFFTQAYYNHKAIETMAINNTDESWVVSLDEKEYIQNVMCKNDKKIKIISTIWDIQKNIAPFAGRTDLLFVGTMEHTTNIEAIEFFVHKIADKLLELGIDIKLNVVGPHIELIDHIKHPSLKKIGYIKDLTNIYGKSLAVFCPLFSGAGIKGKITEALARGVPVITTTIGAQGYIDYDKYMLVSDKTSSLIQYIQDIQNKDLWQKLSKNGKEYITNNLSSKQVSKLVFE